MLTYAGVPLLFPEDASGINAWLQRYYALADLSAFGSPPAVLSAQRGVRSRFEQNKGLGLPVLNYPPSPPARLNQIYWPTGATRWARGFFLVNKAGKDKIVKAALDSSYSQAKTLTWASADTSLDADMYCLPPRPISDVSGADGLWLLTLVDERYWWQYKDFGDNAVTTSTAWSDLFSTFGTQVGKTITLASSVESAYGKPDPTDFSRRYANIALLIDAACASISRRLVRTRDGTLTAQSTSIASSSLTTNLNRPWKRVSGGDFSAERGELPASVIVNYRKIKQYLLQSDNKLYSVTKTGPASNRAMVQSRALTILAAAYADYDTSDVLQNTTFLDDLATQLKTDFYNWQAKNYDYTFAGVQNWDPTGYDDCILWSFGHPCCGELQAQTRVQTLPPNFFADISLASDSSKEIVEPRLMAKANADIAAGAAGDVSLYDSFSHDTGKDVNVTNIASVTWGSGKRGWAEGIGDAAWLGTPSECP